MSRFLSKKFQALEAYTPGEQPKRGEFLKLNTNENPFPPCPKAAALVAEKISDLHIYNDTACKELTAVFAKYHNIDENQVIFSNGSDEILAFCYLAFCDETVGVAFPEISYGFYKVFAALFDIAPTKIPLRGDFSISPLDYYNLGKTIVIANPNAPTGMALSLAEIELILQSNPDNIVVIDEAYAAFGCESAVSLIKKYDNLVVTGTFSKSRSMAGARLGYAISNPALIADLNKMKYSFNPYNVNALTQLLGKISVEEDDYYCTAIDAVVEARTAFVTRLNGMGFVTLPSKSNFVFTRHPDLDGETLYQELRNRKILVRHFTDPKICDFCRISIGTMADMTRVADSLEQILEV
ncbi:MAG: histidinol-phosphate transaminase [Eubacteriales bacterium]